MPWTTLRLVLLLALTCGPTSALAGEPAASPAAIEGGNPYVSVQIGLELQSLDSAAREVAGSVDELAAAMQSLTTSPSLTEEQKAEVLAVLGRVDQLSERVTVAVERLPAAVKESRDPLASIVDDLARDVRLTVVLVLLALLVVVVLVLLAVYVFTIRPAGSSLTELVKRLTSLAKSVEVSIDLLGQTNAVQLELAKILEAQRKAIEAARPREVEVPEIEPAAEVAD